MATMAVSKTADWGSIPWSPAETRASDTALRHLRTSGLHCMTECCVERDGLIYLNAMGELAPAPSSPDTASKPLPAVAAWASSTGRRSSALDRTVALKVIAPGLLEDQTIRARFVRESKVAASIDHPNVIPIYYAGEENGIAYIAMRYVGRRRHPQPRPPRAQARARARRADRRADRRRARRRARRRPRPPRHQARQRPARPRGPRLSDRLRAHQARAVASPAPPSPATGSGRSTTSRPSRSAASGSTPAPTSTRSAACSITRSRASVPFERERRRGEALGAPVRAAAEAERARRGSRWRSTP